MIIQIGSAHNKEEMDILLAIARKRLFVNQLELLPQTNPLQIKTKRSFSALLWDMEYPTGTICDIRI